MSRCRKCGAETAGRRICHTCLGAWCAQRRSAYDQAIKELGPMTGENLKQITKRIKELEGKT